MGIRTKDDGEGREMDKFLARNRERYLGPEKKNRQQKKKKKIQVGWVRLD